MKIKWLLGAIVSVIAAGSVRISPDMVMRICYGLFMAIATVGSVIMPFLAIRAYEKMFRNPFSNSSYITTKKELYLQIGGLLAFIALAEFLVWYPDAVSGFAQNLGKTISEHVSFP